MDLWDRWRADLARPEVPVVREELGWLVCSSVATVSIAHLVDPGRWIDLLILVPAVVAFVLRGLAPRLPSEVFAALVIVPVVAVVAGDGVLEGTFFLIVNAVLYAAWHLQSLTRAVAILVPAAVAPWLVAVHLAKGSEIGWSAWTSASAFTFVLGRVLQRQRSLIDELERAREVLAEQAVAEERRRIARELHDLAGHTLAAVLLHVTGARHVLRRDLDEAERALLDAETVGRSSLDQIRATVAALRTNERGTDPSLAGSADLADLVDEYRRAGLVIDASIDDAAAQLEGPIGTALHRIAREALANVARHASANRVDLRVFAGDDMVRLVVADQGRPASQPDTSAGHFGLVGMRERARALGGDLEAEPTSDGWLVTARLPMAAAQRDELLRS